MAILTVTESDYVGLPPRPLIPQQRIINDDGTPTFEFNLFLTTQYEWERRLLSILNGVPYPAPRSGEPEPTPPRRNQILYGRLAASGAISTPSTFTSAKLATGKYRITLPPGVPSAYRVVATPEELAAGAARTVVLAAKTATTFDIWTYSGAAALIDTAFSFITIATE